MAEKEKERIAELRQKYIMDRTSEIRTAKEIGIKEGMKKGIKDVAKKMLQKNIPMEIISELTGLTEEEIKSS